MPTQYPPPSESLPIMPDEVNAKMLTQITNELIAAISSEPFVAAMKKLKETPLEQRLDLARNTLTPTILKQAGVKLPSGMRVTSRYFEPGSPDVIEVTDYGASLLNLNTMSSPGVMGAWACACGGGAGICGGAGGGT